MRLFFKFVMKFLAGFVAANPFVITVIKTYPFTKPEEALDKDWLEIGSYINEVKSKK